MLVGDSMPLPRGNRLAVPLVDLHSCTGCGRCADVCPAGAVSLAAENDGRRPVIDPYRCTYCTACEAACPELAIDCPFEIVGLESTADGALERPHA